MRSEGACKVPSGEDRVKLKLSETPTLVRGPVGCVQLYSRQAQSEEEFSLRSEHHEVHRHLYLAAEGGDRLKPSV